MKRILTFCILLLFVPGLLGFSAHAYDYQTVRVGIEAEVTLGGTVTIIPSVNCPIPDKTVITLQDGEIGRFDIDFSDPGVFDYTVKTIPDEIPDERELEFDDTVYNVRIYVTDADGALVATVIVSTGEEKYSAERLVFVNKAPGGDKPTEKPTQQPTVKPTDKAKETPAPQDSGGSTDNKNKNPQTGDDTRMEMYFLFAMIASAGLLALSIIYLLDTQKMINKKKGSDR